MFTNSVRLFQKKLMRIILIKLVNGWPIASVSQIILNWNKFGKYWLQAIASTKSSRFIRLLRLFSYFIYRNRFTSSFTSSTCRVYLIRICGLICQYLFGLVIVCLHFRNVHLFYYQNYHNVSKSDTCGR